MLGPAVGIMGVLQALAAMKVLMGLGDGVAQSGNQMVLFSGLRTQMFRTVRMGGVRRRGCVACSAEGTVDVESLESGSLAEYESFCGSVPGVDLLKDSDRISAAKLAEILSEPKKDGAVLLDVRDPAHFAVCSLPGAINVPAMRFAQRKRVQDDQDGDAAWWTPKDVSKDAKVFVVCRVGNDSQIVAQRLKDDGWAGDVVDVRGGMRAWRDEVDQTMPFL